MSSKRLIKSRCDTGSKKKLKKSSKTSQKNVTRLPHSPPDGLSIKDKEIDETHLISSLQILDPLLQFLTRTTGRTLVPLQSLRAITPPSKIDILRDIPALHYHGVVHIKRSGATSQDTIAQRCDYLRNLFAIENHTGYADVTVGFPPPPITQVSINGDNDADHDEDKNGIEDGNVKKKKEPSLHGSTKAAAKRRLSALKRSLKQKRSFSCTSIEYKQGKTSKEYDIKGNLTNTETHDGPTVSRSVCPLDDMVNNPKYQQYSVKEQYQRIKAKDEKNMDDDIGDQILSKEALAALDELRHLLSGVGEDDVTKSATCTETTQGKNTTRNKDDCHISLNRKDKCASQFILKNQAAFAGSHRARVSHNGYLSEEMRHRIPTILTDVMGLQLFKDEKEGCMSTCGNRLKLYSHQATAIEAVLLGIHTLVCTGTGSGKSLCFLLPVLAEVMMTDVECGNRDKAKSSMPNRSDEPACNTALLMFPTKALAQDQLSKLLALVKSHPMLEKHIRPGVIDGDTPHAQRTFIAKHCNIILSNPDTLHAAILPQWKGIYKGLLAQIKFVVIDELHVYEGAFGAHVSLVLSRFLRVCCIAKHTSNVVRKLGLPVFIGCSATICHPEDYFRLLCPISSGDQVCILTQEEDGSPCTAKHFFVWNPPLIDAEGKASDQIVGRPAKSSKSGQTLLHTDPIEIARSLKFSEHVCDFPEKRMNDDHHQPIRRVHAADETARVLAQAVKVGIRCIAFCKTRMLAEWVYERCISILQSDLGTTDLSTRVEVYRGGYSASIRRDIEKRLFCNELFGVVATSALELGVDIGGIDLTLHCGYPGSISSLMQQAGRAGRGGAKDMSSFSIMICFSAPSEQHLWKYPKRLLSRGLDSPPSVPLNAGIVQGHLLCAGKEFPLVGSHSVTALFYLSPDLQTMSIQNMLTDHELFGSKAVYIEAAEQLIERGHLWQEKANKTNGLGALSTHPSMKKPTMHVSLRSIEPISYSIVDMSHPTQGGRNDGVHDQAAVMDSIPYSRVFYHAYPGAIIMHRGIRYKIHSISMPPAFATCAIGYQYNSSNLGAFAKPTTARYSTRPLSINHFTVIKQLHRVEVSKSAFIKAIEGNDDQDMKGAVKPISFEPKLTFGCIAGSGVINVKKTVHGYTKLSLVNRTELSRTEISVPPMEYDTNALWVDAEAAELNSVMIDFDAGVHALSHAIVAVAPLFVPCTSSDIDCDHCRNGCTRVLLYDVRAGGAGTSAQLWKHFFTPNGVLDAAIDLLSECPSCGETGNYKGGCPGCIQSVPCVNFQQDLNRTAGLHIARRMLARLQQSSLYRQHCDTKNNIKSGDKPVSPAELKRFKALHNASDLVSARKRNIVVGRPTWPTDEATKTTTEDNW